MEKLTKEQIEKLKHTHGEVFEVEVSDKICYLKKPSRKVLSAAATVGQKDALKYNEILLENCWIQGDDEIRNNDSYFLGVSGVLAQVIEIKEAKLKKL